jgi:hypothetical protein
MVQTRKKDKSELGRETTKALLGRDQVLCTFASRVIL